MNQRGELIRLKSNKAKESTEGEFLQRGFGCAQQHRPALKHAGTTERPEKCGLGCSSSWENAHWTMERDAEVRSGFLSPTCQESATPCCGSSSWDSCFALDQRESRNCCPQLWCWGIGYTIRLGYNKSKSISLLNSASEHGHKMILSGSVASELITQLCEMSLHKVSLLRNHLSWLQCATGIWIN